MKEGTLTIVGTGIQAVAQTTIEARAIMEQAEKLLYVVAEPVTEAWIRQLNPAAESLRDCYAEGKPRIQTYQEMVERTLSWVRRGHHTCLALYGHPGVFVFPSHRAIEKAREEGFEARMLPGVSAEDCMFADLGFDPAIHGCQTYEATDMLIRRRTIDSTCNLIVWQIGFIGELKYRKKDVYKREGIDMLVDILEEHYPSDHEVVLYEASQYSIAEPVLTRVSLAELRVCEIPGIATLHVPPLTQRPPDEAVIERLGLRL